MSSPACEWNGHFLCEPLNLFTWSWLLAPRHTYSSHKKYSIKGAGNVRICSSVNPWTSFITNCFLVVSSSKARRWLIQMFMAAIPKMFVHTASIEHRNAIQLSQWVNFWYDSSKSNQLMNSLFVDHIESVPEFLHETPWTIYGCMNKNQCPKYYRKAVWPNQIYPNNIGLNQCDTELRTVGIWTEYITTWTFCGVKKNKELKANFLRYFRNLLDSLTKKKLCILTKGVEPRTLNCVLSSSPESCLHSGFNAHLISHVIEALPLGHKFCIFTRRKDKLDCGVHFDTVAKLKFWSRPLQNQYTLDMP